MKMRTSIIYEARRIILLWVCNVKKLLWDLKISSKMSKVLCSSILSKLLSVSFKIVRRSIFERFQIFGWSVDYESSANFNLLFIYIESNLDCFRAQKQHKYWKHVHVEEEYRNVKGMLSKLHRELESIRKRFRLNEETNSIFIYIFAVHGAL